MNPENIPAVLSPRDPATRECCDRTPTAEMLHAFEQFNRGEFWEQHETLELVWRAETDASIRNFYKGILQVGVGFHHLRNGNYNGVIKVLGRGINYLKPYEPTCYGVDVTRLIREASPVWWKVKEVGRERIGEVKGMELPRVHLMKKDRARETTVNYSTVAEARIGESTRKLAFEEYLALDDSYAQTEWVNGEVRVYMPASIRHQMIVAFLDRLLGLLVEMLGLGIVLTDRIAMRTLVSTAREPDLLFVSKGNMERVEPTHLSGAADFVVEVVSDDSVARDRDDKFFEYQAAGVREYLIIDPREGKERLDWYSLDANRKYLAILADNEGRYRSTIIPGFWLRQEWLAAETMPDHISAYIEMRGLGQEESDLLRRLLTAQVKNNR
jgi:Uma2 family endonuclease/predicted metal-dependent hydrolase